MSNAILVQAITVMALSGAPSADTSADPHAEQLRTAREAFAQIREGHYQAFLETCTKDVRDKLPPATLGLIVTGLEQQFGQYVREVRSESVTHGDAVLVYLICEYAEGALKVQMTIDKQGRIAGLFFTPATQAVEYKPPNYVNENLFEEEEVVVSAGEFPLGGTLTLPRAVGPFPAVVLVHGSGPNDRDETIFSRKPFRDIAWGLATEGIAVLRYDKRTLNHGASMNPMTITIDSEVADDAIAAVRLLLKRKDIAKDRVFIIGHSLGAGAAPYIGLREPAIAGVVLLAGPARPIYELANEQIPYIAAADGKIDEQEQTLINSTRAVVAKLRNNTFGPEDTLLGAPASYWAATEKMAPIASARKLNKPILIVQGGRDYQVTKRDFAIWEKELAEADNVTLRLFESLDHLLISGEGPSTPEQYREPGHVDGRVIGLLAQWVRSQGS